MNRTILITGAAKRIGAELASSFAEKHWNVVINYNNSEEEAMLLAKKINNMYGNAIIFKADITNPIEVRNMFQFAINKFEQIDTLINNAAVYPERKTINEITYEQWNNTLNVNLNAILITSKEFAKQNIPNGRIINIASIGGINIFKNRIDYNLSKAAVIRLTKILAKELAPNISVNCVCPGIIQINNEKIDIPINNIPMQRYATFQDLLDAIYFFATSSNYITGQIISVAGGMELLN